MNQLIFHLKTLADASVTTPADGDFQTGLPQVGASGGAGYKDAQTVLALVFGAIGAAAVIFIIIAAIRYIMSNGDPQATARAKNTIIYAAVGLAFALSAEIIVTYVLNNV